jgi:succinate dehydrogenase hydrophobic membrane anchor protein
MKVTREHLEDTLISGLRRLPRVSFYADTRGWSFVVSWAHRITGLFVVLMVLFHVFWFQPSPEPGRFFLISFLQWVLSIPVVFHAFNGARVMQYECWGRRDDENMLRWVFGLSAVFAVLLALFIVVGGQQVSPFLYWLLMIAGAFATGYAAWARIWNTKHSVFWKMQRVSGAFLLVMIPAYVLFIHLHPAIKPGANIVTSGIQVVTVKGVYLLLLFAALYHGGYGVWSVVSDYVSSQALQKALVAVVVLIFAVFFWTGLRTIIGI